MAFTGSETIRNDSNSTGEQPQKSKDPKTLGKETEKATGRGKDCTYSGVNRFNVVKMAVLRWFTESMQFPSKFQ